MDFNIPFMKYRKIAAYASLALFVISLLSTILPRPLSVIPVLLPLVSFTPKPSTTTFVTLAQTVVKLPTFTFKLQPDPLPESVICATVNSS